MRSLSVVIPAFQAEQFLAEAITSVLDQCWPDLQLIVVDDGSTDGTAGVARSFGASVQLICQPNRGPGHARNTGLAVATGELLGFCDADDRWTPGRIESQVAMLERTGADGVFGMVRQFVSPEVDPTSIRLPASAMAVRLASAMLVTRAGFDRVGPFPDVRAPDVAWAVAAAASDARLVQLDEIVLERRIHGANMGLTNPEEGHRARLVALKRHLDDQRANDRRSDVDGSTR